MVKLSTLKPRLQSFDARRVQAPAKVAKSIYHTPEYLAWRGAVIARAGGQCEAIDKGRRCPKAQPRHRMFADHKHEITDGGARFDPAIGECLCGAHHTLKTARARATRRFA
jgi:hypothetical protein